LLSVPGAGQGPVFGGQFPARLLVQYDRLHHLAQDAVGQNHDRHSILVSQIEGQRHAIGKLLHARWPQHYRSIIAVPAAASGLEIIGL